MKVVVTIFLMLALSGCSVAPHTTVVVNSTVPVIPVVEKPKQELLTADELVPYRALPETIRIKLEGNDKAVKIYATQCAESIRVYNEYAKQHNAANQGWIDSIGKGQK